MRTVLAIALTAALGIAAPPAAAQAGCPHGQGPCPHAQQHAQHAQHASPAATTAASAPAQAAPAKRYATDATLREEMQGIRSAVTGLEHYAMGHVDQPQALSLASQIEEGVRTIIANCKLPPDADAALHTIIVPLMQNAGALKKDPKNFAVIKPMQDAVAAYAQQFDDPGLDAAE